MSLKIKNIQLNNFRNYNSFNLELDPCLTLIVGENAIGKTNCIEAIQFLCTGSSFRKPLKKDVISSGKTSTSLSLNAFDSETGRVLNTQLFFDEKGKRIEINGKKKSIANLKGILPAVLFTPDHLQIIKESATKRRRALDEIGTQLFPSYYSAKQEYEKIVQQRNALLKDTTCNQVLLDSWSESLTLFGGIFFVRRLRLLQLFAPKVIEIYKEISPTETLEIEYIPSWNNVLTTEEDFETNESQETLKISNLYNIEEICSKEKQQAEEFATKNLMAVFATVKEKERACGVSLYGPHRDEIVFKINGRDARTFGSQGQQRSIILAWKLAETQLIKQISDQPPVLLLDDVMSELDENRRKMLTSFVKENIQTIITATDISAFDQELLKGAKIIKRERVN
jgi:DNA replication and repair protein RecF